MDGSDEGRAGWAPPIAEVVSDNPNQDGDQRRHVEHAEREKGQQRLLSVVHLELATRWSGRSRLRPPFLGGDDPFGGQLDRSTWGLRSRLRRFDPACARVASLASSERAMAGTRAALRRRGSPYALPTLAGPAVPAVGRDRALRARNAHGLPAGESGLAVLVQPAFLALTENAHLPEAWLPRAVGARFAPSIVPLAGMTAGQRKDDQGENVLPDGTAHGFSLEELGQSSTRVL